MKAKDVITRRTFRGAWVCSAIIEGFLVHRQYFGYTRREAIRAFIKAEGKV